MTASFRLTLDTLTEITAMINGGKPTTEKSTVTLELGLDPDAALVKIWGDLNPLDPMNAGMGTTEAEAEWLDASADWLVALTTNPGGKELHVRVRDDVDNEATASASISLAGETPTPPAPPGPEGIPATGGPEVVPKPIRRELATTSTAGSISSAALVATTRTLAPIGIGRIRSSTGNRGSSMSPGLTEIRTRVEQSIKARVVGVRQPPGSVLGTGRGSATVHRRDGEDFIAALVELGIL